MHWLGCEYLLYKASATVATSVQDEHLGIHTDCNESGASSRSM